ncbi:type II toxin-antitoxin system VapC family toxin [Sphingomonas echinoides]|uniref:Type II toxin-antitoxin system VapC family toxin n=1 Tax=Sphingomonas echinoides TaxID=59803 RepID=A0ABU4PJY8_9SPHN|nr:type II toxin-antitoxin system VapC family toxin [Sphingomonas echinoides]MDX5984500.1 type II toxin-antitoxin system VapC family toxin [Sphingomonas echinoides]
MILVDTNVLIDLRDRDPAWEPWSMRAVALARLAGPVGTTAVTVGELASRGGTLVELRELCSAFGIPLLPLSVAGAYHAGQAHRAYRAAGGGREKLLADFLIGGEAEALGAQLLTRDPRPYRRYFPDLTLITPETDA